jgi:hypothetical protein
VGENVILVTLSVSRCLQLVKTIFLPDLSLQKVAENGKRMQTARKMSVSGPNLVTLFGQLGISSRFLTTPAFTFRFFWFFVMDAIFTLVLASFVSL